MALMGNFRAQMLWDNISKRDLSAVVNLLESGNINLEERDDSGQTFLMVACQQGEVTMVREILGAGSDPDAIDNDNWTALMYATRLGSLEICIELLEKNANIEHRDLCGWTALMWASYKGHEDVVCELLEHGADPNIKAEHNMTCLMWASGRGHTGVVKALVQKGARVNSADKYGTTALIWACRKGYLEIVKTLLLSGAHVDNTGMDSLTALLVATKGGYGGVVQVLLEHNPNVNAVDKDGFTALTIAAKEGYFDVVQELLANDAYVNLADRAGDTILIHAVKGGHTDVVRALLNRYADLDVEGNDRKTSLYWAVEKGHTDIVKLLLSNNPDVEICTKDGDTPLMRAVRNRHELCVRLLLDKGAKVSTVDKKGDTALHISLRARSKRITELLLRNPRNSRLLYRPNKNGETPYSIDAYHQRGILSQIHGHRKLNASDGENLLGYEIYSSALADILSEPSLNTPITVGLYAKWGSGKSFLLSKLQGEMKSFTKANADDHLQFTKSLFIILLIFNVLIGSVLALALQSFHWEIGLAAGFGLFFFEYGFLAVVWVCSQKYNMRFAESVSQAIGKKVIILTLLLKVLFFNPTAHSSNPKTVPLVRFLFSDNTRLSSVGGEKALAAMVARLSESVEEEFGFLSARLFSVFRPHTDRSNPGRFKTFCCIPVVAIVVFVILCLAVGVTLLIIYKISDNEVVNGVMIAMALVVGLTMLTYIQTLGKAIIAMFVSQRKRVMRAADSLHVLKMDGFMHKLKYEVNLMNNFVLSMDKFTGNTTRLVVVVDGLDSCEQDKVLQVLDIIQALFNDENSPFVTILAVDPQVIIKGIEQNLSTMFQDSSVNGFDYLRNIVHLPFYLQSQGLQIQKEKMATSLSISDVHAAHGAESPHKSYRHQDSTVSQISGFSVIDPTVKKTGNQRKREDSVGTVYHSNFDLTHTFTKNDYFSDINPRSMRRLMNIVAVTGRLLRAYNIDFNWHRLAAWVNIVEQWPYRLSWIILYFEENDGLADDVTVKSIYYKIASQLPVSSEMDPLLEIDRNIRKLEAFLSNKSVTSPMLNIGDLKKFLPCTINLDPYLRKLIRNQQQTASLQPDLSLGMFSHKPSSTSLQQLTSDSEGPRTSGMVRQSPFRTPTRQPVNNMLPNPMMPYGPMGVPPQMMPMMSQYLMGMMPHLGPSGVAVPGVKQPPPSQFIQDYDYEMLSKMSTSDVSTLLIRLRGINPQMLSQYQQTLEENNISGLVLTSCDLDDLGKVLQMKFGDWQIFRSAILSLRETEILLLEEQEVRQASEKERSGSVSSTKSTHFPNHLSGTSVSVNDSDMGAKQKSSVAFNRQSSVDTQRSDRSESGSRFGIIKEEEEEDVTRNFRRNDSVVAEMMYESGLLQQAMKNFAETVDEDDDDDEEEKDGAKGTEDEADDSSHSERPSSRKRGLPVQFTLTSYHGEGETEPNDSQNNMGEAAKETTPLLSSSPRAKTESPKANSKSILKKNRSPETARRSSTTFYEVVSVHSEPDLTGKRKDGYVQMESSNLLKSPKQSLSATSGGFTTLQEQSITSMSGGSLDVVTVVNETVEAGGSLPSTTPSTSHIKLEDSIQQFTKSEASRQNQTTTSV